MENVRIITSATTCDENKEEKILDGKIGEKVILSIIWWMRKNTQNKKENEEAKVFFTKVHQIGGENLTKIE